MKAQFVVEKMQIRLPAYPHLTAEHLVERDGHIYALPGCIDSSPDAYKCVRAGFAIPVDDECRDAAGMTIEQWKEARFMHDRAQLRVHPEDYDAYAKGYMIGYDKGKWIPGPNHAEWLATQQADEEGDD